MAAVVVYESCTTQGDDICLWQQTRNLLSRYISCSQPLLEYFEFLHVWFNIRYERKCPITAVIKAPTETFFTALSIRLSIKQCNTDSLLEDIYPRFLLTLIYMIMIC
jgi:hypothetical protein